MVESEKFPEPIFTPATKAEIGLHDENISEEIANKLLAKKRLILSSKNNQNI